MPRLSTFVSELQRRKVIQTFVPYLGFVWLLLQIVSVITPMLRLSPLVATFFAVLLFAGMPIMLYLSWYFDFTSKGLVAIAELGTDEAKPLSPLMWLGLVFITLGSGALGYSYFSDLKTDFAKNQQGIQQILIADSIAVLPFKDASPDRDQSFIAQGLAEEITSLLGRTDGLRVAASSSSAIVDAKNMDPVAIGKRLDVQTLLTGSVRRTGDRLKIRVELVNTADGKVLWTETFARKFENIFVLESEIARSTVNLLQDTYMEAGHFTNTASTNSTDAYVIYLKGREQYRKQTTESMKEARKLFEQAIGLDPEYAQAYVALASTLELLAEGPQRFGVIKTSIAKQLAEQHLEKALVREPKMAEAYAARGRILELTDNIDDALAAYNKAIDLNPNLALAHMWRYLVLKKLGRLNESWAALEKAHRLDPLSISISYNRYFELSRRGKFTQAKSGFEQLTVEFKDSPMGYAGLAEVNFEMGELALSLMNWKRAYEISRNSENYKRKYISLLLDLNLQQQLRPFFSDPNYKTNILYLKGDFEGLQNEIEFQLQAYPDDPWLAYEAGWWNMLQGNEQKSITYLLIAYAAFTPEQIYNMPDCSPAIEIAWALKRSGDDAQYKTITNECEIRLNKLLSSGLTYANNSYLKARLAALRGNNVSAIKALSKVVKQGWREWWTEKDPLLAGLHDNTEVQHLFGFIQDQRVQERQKALTLLSTEADSQ